MKPSWIVGASICSLVTAGAAHAHPLAPSLLRFEAQDDTHVTLSFRAPLIQPVGQSLRPAIPSSCRPVEASRFTRDAQALTETVRLACARADLVGERVTVSGIEDATTSVVVRVVDREGRSQSQVLDAHATSFRVRVANEAESPLSLVRAVIMGIEHLVTGWDHIAFVLGLLVLLGWRRRLVVAVTSFTVGHSVTLALATFGVIAVPSLWVEAMIAATVLMLAVEIAGGAQSPLQRFPWSLSLVVGLVHGLGFASVMLEAGLPREDVPLALLGFNLGLELGQLGLIGCAVVPWLVLYSRWRPPEWLRVGVPAHVIGGSAAFWLFERVFAALGALN